MVEEDVATVAARLEQIWSFEGEGLVFRVDEFSFHGHLKGQVRFVCYCYGFGTRQDPYTVVISDDGEGGGTLNFSQGVIYDSYQNMHPDEEFVRQWLETFRRKCWLSGCPIEASAHEKAEWMQGFTKEEIEAWNLKF